MTYVPNLAHVEGHLAEGANPHVVPHDVMENLRTLPVVDRWEWNGYDDSDFYIAVYDEGRDTFFRVMTWSTRFARPDDLYDPKPNASPELRAEYQRRINQSYKVARMRRQLRESRRHFEKAKAACAALGLSKTARLNIYRWVREAETCQQGLDRLALISAKLRSEFKISLREQVIAWANGETKYVTPLSPRQLAALDTSRFRR